MTHRFVVLLLITTVTNVWGGLVNVAPERGRPLALINWTDETGRTRQLSEFSGYPLILLPIYTRCPGPCVQTVERLKEALTDSATDISQCRVLLFSFDPSDDPATLAKYRRREKIPLGWSLGTSTPENIDALLESIGIQVGKAGTEFTHPNLLLFLDRKLRTAKWIYGTLYSEADIDSALQVASGRNDWIGQHSDLLYALLLFAGSILCVTLAYYLGQWRQQRVSSRSGQPRRSPLVGV
jgi:cytochrome oxidase Cu insertion factor (SCO1/SenC/PrrC family)